MFRSIAVRSFRFALGAPLLVAGAPFPESRATISPSLVRLAPGGEQRSKAIIVATRLMGAQDPGEAKWSCGKDGQDRVRC